MNYFERQQKIDEIFRGLIEKLESSGKAFVIRAKRINDDWSDDDDCDEVTYPTVFRILFEIKERVVGAGIYTIEADEHLFLKDDTLNLWLSKEYSYEYYLDEVTVDVIANDLIEFIDSEIEYVNWVHSVENYLDNVNESTGDKEFVLDDYQNADRLPKIKCIDSDWHKLFSFDVDRFADLQKIYEDITRYSAFHGVDFRTK